MTRDEVDRLVDALQEAIGDNWKLRVMHSPAEDAYLVAITPNVFGEMVLDGKHTVGAPNALLKNKQAELVAAIANMCQQLTQVNL